MIVYCLCADWCTTCREFRKLLASWTEAGLHWVWVDIEDQAERLGELDIETFPTLLIESAGAARFFGPVLPTRAAVQQLLDHCAAWPALQGEAAALLQSLRD